MSGFKLEFTWVFDTPIHFGTGLSRSGFADRLIRLDANKNPYLPGDAVKGAVRGSAERLARWLGAPVKVEAEDHSLPGHPVLERLFRASDENGRYYRFGAGRFERGGSNVTFSSTAIDQKSGAAKDDTLRTLQAWSRGARFRIGIHGFQGDWEDPDSHDRAELLFCAARCSLPRESGARRVSATDRFALAISPAMSPAVFGTI